MAGIRFHRGENFPDDALKYLGIKYEDLPDRDDIERPKFKILDKMNALEVRNELIESFGFTEVQSQYKNAKKMRTVLNYCRKNYIKSGDDYFKTEHALKLK